MSDNRTKYKYPASLACQVRSAIRIRDELPYEEMVKILKKEILYNPESHQIYFLAFFEECSLRLIKKFMSEQNITREEILDMFNTLPDLGEKAYFAEAIRDGKF